MSEYKSFYVSNISGSAISGISSGWSTMYYVNGVSVSGSTTTVSEISGGLYQVALSYVPEGELTLLLKNSNSAYIIYPTFQEWTKSSTYTLDDIYGKLVVATSSTSLPITPSQRYSVITINGKEGDVITETVQVPSRYRPLTGWTNLSIQAYPAARLLDSTTLPLSGTYSVSLINATDGIVDISIGKNVTSNKVPSGVSNVTIYADLQGDDTLGNRRTMSEFTINLRRDFNSNN